MALTYLLYLAMVFYWQLRRVRTGKSTKVGTLGCYLGYGIVPAILYTAVFFGLVGIEALTGRALISEPYARALPLVLLGGTVIVGVTGLVFALAAFLLPAKQQGAD